jgi:hypothetical protein
MAGGKGGAKKLRRSTGSVAAGEARKVSSSKSKSRGKPAPAVGTALVKAASAPPPTLAVPETLDMAIDDETSASITKQIRKAGKSGGASSSAAGAVVYLGHIPHGFYEEQMKGFFSQFGLVNRIHLARNRKVRAGPTDLAGALRPARRCSHRPPSRADAHADFRLSAVALLRRAPRSTTPSSSLRTRRLRPSWPRRCTAT